MERLLNLALFLILLNKDLGFFFFFLNLSPYFLNVVPKSYKHLLFELVFIISVISTHF